MHEIETEQVHGLTVTLVQDDDAESPREWDNVGTMVCWHSRYSLGDKHEFGDPDDFREWWEENGKDGIRLPLFLYDHSGITMSTGAFSCPWDSGQVGWIYVTADDIKEHLGPDWQTPAKVEEYLTGEVETYDTFIRGDVVGYVVSAPEGDELASCWGFYSQEEAMSEAKGEAEHHGTIRNAEAAQEWVKATWGGE